MAKVKFNVWPNKLIELEALDISEVLRAEAPAESILKIADGQTHTVLHTPREVQRMLRDADRPKLDASDVITAVQAEFELRRPGARLSDEAEIMLEVLIEKINAVLAAQTR